MSTLYEELGGEAAVDAAVYVFYRNVLSDARISRFFDDIDMDEQMAKQKAFLTMAFGGPSHYSGKDMREAHQRLVDEMGLTEEHFVAFAESLINALAELEIPQDLIDEVAGIAASTKEDVLCL